MKHERIWIDPKVMVGKPCIRGTRITVEHILRELGRPVSVEELLQQHPRLSREDILSAQEFAADYLAAETVICGNAQP